MNDLLNTAPCGFLSFSSDGIVLAVNETLADWLATTPDKIQGQPIGSILSTAGNAFFETSFWPQLQLQTQLEEVYFALRSKNGESVPVLANAACANRDGNVIYDCVLLRIRQRDLYENDLIMARNEAEQANQAKTDFLSMMSHELRTPLSVISGYTQILASEGSGPITALQREDLNCIKRGSDQLLRLISDILNYAQMEQGEVEVKSEIVNVEDEILRAESFMKPRLQEAGLHYENHLSEMRLMATADAGRVQQILLNMLTNAIKFTPRGGSVCVTCSQPQNKVLIEVRDTGCGIADDHIGRIFEPFVQIDRLQVDSSQRGVGLGLSICRKLARAMSGDLTVNSTVGEGSVFTLALPKYEPEFVFASPH